ncbi:hypothetical protein [Roseomonas indoligenes]|uniref:Uncharacterized protein n=1 Tax=Roseomonas indoligenes TaxID=2820811 RepID=A0A940MWE5_9PROT|nr:hypothetical protein [Pararoseomonas indoligenes]MBP0492039.1 hypothetical protein [Pararoseomonas indoligenes]
MDRLLFSMWRIWRNPPSRMKLIVMLAALALAIGLVLVERRVGWPDWMRVERTPRPRLPHL